MRLRSHSDVAKLALGATAVASFVVACAIMALYPREEWPWELGLSLTLTVTLTMTISTWIGRKTLETERLTQELQRLVERDRLTDAATRDFFFGQLDRNPDGYGVSLMVDIDHFKSVNDRYGHLVGDAVIRDVAQVLRNAVRTDDIVCRFGGEEFVIFLRDYDAVDAFAVAERMRKAIADKLIQAETNAVRVTVSIGGSLRERIADIDRAISQADAALYRAKAGGRNRTVFADEEPTGDQQAFAVGDGIPK